MTAQVLEAGFGAAIITPPTPVQLAGFIDDQPATEVHDDLEVRALVLRGEHGGAVPARVRPARAVARLRDPVRDAVAAALDLDRAAVLTSCIHTHAGPSTLEGSHRLGWVTPDGYRELLVDRCVAAAARGRGRGRPRHDCAPVVGRSPTGCRSTGGACPTSRPSRSST